MSWRIFTNEIWETESEKATDLCKRNNFKKNLNGKLYPMI